MALRACCTAEGEKVGEYALLCTMELFNTGQDRVKSHVMGSLSLAESLPALWGQSCEARQIPRCPTCGLMHASLCLLLQNRKTGYDKKALEIDPAQPAFTRRREVFAGRLAMLGFASALIGEVRPTLPYI